MTSQGGGANFFKSELGLRIASAVVLLIIVLAFAWVGGWPFKLLCLLISALLFYEWQSIVRITPFDGTEALLSLGFGVLLLSPLFGVTIYAFIAFILLGLVLELSSSGSEKSDVRWIGLGALYCAIPALCFPLIRDFGGLALLLFVFITVWITDIAAYFAGRQFGGPKLLPAVSPKKTWSGAIGGLMCAVFGALLFAYFVDGMSTGWAVVMAVVLSVVSQAGDFFESWVKRLFNVKDSSQLIPGHGGFLDRLDGLVAAAVPVAVMVALSIN